MKAEHRKELHTNWLADRLGRVFKENRSSSSTIWTIVLLIGALVVAFWWWTSRAADARSVAWIDHWYGRTSPEGAERVAKRYEGTAAGYAAELAQADGLYQDAYQDFFRSPEDARKKFARASEVYENLMNNPGYSSDIAARAILGKAKCEEWLGEIERARYFYEDLVSRYGTHPLASEARERLKELNDSGSVAFYTKWPNRLPTVVESTDKNPSPPALPGTAPGN